MAGSFRVSFVDIDSSFSVAQEDSTVYGYMVVKAPKGNAIPTYFKPGSAAKILQLVGAPSATYPHIQDAIDFNQSFGLFLSSPPGTSELYPSYYGGKYFTEYGIYDFDRVTDVETPNYTGLLAFGSETSASAGDDAAKSRNGTSKAWHLTRIVPFIYNLATGMRITYTAEGSLKDETIDVTINKSTGKIMVGTEEVGSIEDNTDVDHLGFYEFTFPGTNVDVPLLAFGNGTGLPAESYVTSTVFATKLRIEWKLDLTDNTYFYAYQRSPQEVPTTLSILKMGEYFNVVATGSSTTLTATNHGLASGTAVKFTTTGTLPGNIDAVTTYYVLTAGLTTDTFRVGLTRGGAAISTADAGTGLHSVNDAAVPLNTLKFSMSEEGLPGKISSGGTYTASLDLTSKDGFGSNNFIETIIAANSGKYVEFKVVKKFTQELAVHIGTPVLTLMGQRYAVSTGAVDLTILQTGWDAANDDAFDQVDVFMEPTGIPELKSTMAAYRAETFKTSTFIAPVLGDTFEELMTGRSGSPSVAGLAYYANQFRRSEGYTGSTFWSNCIGAIGAKLAIIMKNKMGGWAPMYTDLGGLGGQLAVTAQKQKIKFTQDQQREADEMGLNLIIQDSFHGPMIIGQKTAQSPGNLTDYSYLAHTMAFDQFKREIEKSVLIPQIGKPIDDEFMNIRQLQADAILARRLSGANKIWTAGVVDAFTYNDDIAKAASTFKLSIKVKVTRFSEFVELTLENIAQTTSI